jgi:hypothetical protein
MANGDELQPFVNENPWRVETTDWVDNDLRSLNDGEIRVFEAFRELLRNVDPHTRVFHYQVGPIEAVEVTYTLTRGAADQVILKCSVPASERRKITLKAVYRIAEPPVGPVCLISEVTVNRT